MITVKSVWQQRKNLAVIEQMCGILLLMMRHNQGDLAMQKEFEGLFKALQTAEPCGALEVKRIDREIISCLDEIKELLKVKSSRERAVAIMADIGLKLYERKLKVDKHK